MDGYSVWDEASRDYDAEARLVAQANFRVASSGVMQFLALAETSDEFDGRLMLAASQVRALADESGLSLDEVTSSLRNRWEMIHEAGIREMTEKAKAKAAEVAGAAGDAAEKVGDDVAETGKIFKQKMDPRKEEVKDAVIDGIKRIPRFMVDPAGATVKTVKEIGTPIAKGVAETAQEKRKRSKSASAGGGCQNPGCEENAGIDSPYCQRCSMLVHASLRTVAHFKCHAPGCNQPASMNRHGDKIYCRSCALDEVGHTDNWGNPLCLSCAEDAEEGHLWDGHPIRREELDDMELTDNGVQDVDCSECGSSLRDPEHGPNPYSASRKTAASDICKGPNCNEPTNPNSWGDRRYCFNCASHEFGHTDNWGNPLCLSCAEDTEEHHLWDGHHIRREELDERELEDRDYHTCSQCNEPLRGPEDGPNPLLAYASRKTSKAQTTCDGVEMWASNGDYGDGTCEYGSMVNVGEGACERCQRDAERMYGTQPMPKTSARGVRQEGGRWKVVDDQGNTVSVHDTKEQAVSSYKSMKRTKQPKAPSVKKSSGSRPNFNQAVTDDYACEGCGSYDESLSRGSSFCDRCVSAGIPDLMNSSVRERRVNAENNRRRRASLSEQVWDDLYKMAEWKVGDPDPATTRFDRPPEATPGTPEHKEQLEKERKQRKLDTETRVNRRALEDQRRWVQNNSITSSQKAGNKSRCGHLEAEQTFIHGDPEMGLQFKCDSCGKNAGACCGTAVDAGNQMMFFCGPCHDESNMDLDDFAHKVSSLGYFTGAILHCRKCGKTADESEFGQNEGPECPDCGSKEVFEDDQQTTAVRKNALVDTNAPQGMNDYGQNEGPNLAGAKFTPDGTKPDVPSKSQTNPANKPNQFNPKSNGGDIGMGFEPDTSSMYDSTTTASKTELLIATAKVLENNPHLSDEEAQKIAFSVLSNISTDAGWRDMAPNVESGPIAKGLSNATINAAENLVNKKIPGGKGGPSAGGMSVNKLIKGPDTAIPEAGKAINQKMSISTDSPVDGAQEQASVDTIDNEIERPIPLGERPEDDGLYKRDRYRYTKVPELSRNPRTQPAKPRPPRGPGRPKRT